MTLPHPTDTLCPVCEVVFRQPERKQGGGCRAIYCSRKCLSKDWTRKNKEKRRATILAYETRPENKERKKERNRKDRCRLYGLTYAAFQCQSLRQGNACYGCMRQFTSDRPPCIDHNHSSGKVRGLLCADCNFGLGQLRDNATTLRRLMSYLEYSYDRLGVYVAGALKNPRIVEIGNTLRAEGFDVFDDWFSAGEFADRSWHEYEKARGRQYSEALTGRSAQNVFEFDRTHIDHCDVFVLVSPAGKSGYLELGYAKGRGKKVCLLLEGEPERYDVMPAGSDQVMYSLEALIPWLHSLVPSIEACAPTLPVDEQRLARMRRK